MQECMHCQFDEYRQCIKKEYHLFGCYYSKKKKVEHEFKILVRDSSYTHMHVGCTNSDHDLNKSGLDKWLFSRQTLLITRKLLNKTKIQCDMNNVMYVCIYVPNLSLM